MTLIDKYSLYIYLFNLKNLNIGVETPSQSRFVGYFDIIKNQLGGVLPSNQTLILKKMHINSIRG